jgi:hypothetical protein
MMGLGWRGVGYEMARMEARVVGKIMGMKWISDHEFLLVAEAGVVIVIVVGDVDLMVIVAVDDHHEMEVDVDDNRWSWRTSHSISHSQIDRGQVDEPKPSALVDHEEQSCRDRDTISVACESFVVSLTLKEDVRRANQMARMGPRSPYHSHYETQR